MRRLLEHWRRSLSHRPRTIRLSGHRLVIPPGVMDPIRFRSGAWFAPWVAERIRPGQRLLDLGCGSGVVGVLAQARGARVVAVDVDPAACAAARRNGLHDARLGDLFSPVQTERFDRVCFNPPYLAGEPRGRRFDRALYGGSDQSVIRRFSEAVHDHLTPQGRAWVILSERGAGAVEALGSGWRCIDTAHVRRERLEIWETENAERNAEENA